jgi:myo-inositol-1(or 4)-monophosphatase
MESSDITKKVEELARKAGALALAGASSVLASFKGGDPRDVVTNIDLEISAYLKAEIAKCYPEHHFYSEEDVSVIDPHAYTWIIDPIDGSSNYARGLPHYGVCVTVLYQNCVVAAAVYNPVTTECFTLGHDGPYCNGHSIEVGGATMLSEAYVNFHPGRRPEHRGWAGETQVALLELAKKSINLAASAMDLCYTACGKTDVVIYGTLSTLDVCGAIAILRSAGGEVYSYETKEPVLYLSTPQRVIATAHRALLDDYFTQIMSM